MILKCPNCGIESKDEDFAEGNEHCSVWTNNEGKQVCECWEREEEWEQ